MDTLTIGQYATAHKLAAEGLVQLIAESRDAPDVTVGTLVPVGELDRAAAIVDEVARDDLLDALEGVEDARAVLAEAESNLRCSVREALGEGMAATRVAEVLGVSRARVYQLRDDKR